MSWIIPILQTIFTAGIAPAASSPSLNKIYHSERCTASNPICWPTSSEWNSFNSSINGRLIRSHPSAAICHAALYDANQCAIARANWTSSFWRTAQPGAYSAILWEMGDQTCSLNGSTSKPCQQGLVAEYSVIATGVEDIQAAVMFAAAKSLYLVVKNTGHDHLGRSSGKGSFAIWTYNLKGREWHSEFVPKNAPSNTRGVSAVTLQAGEQWLDVYEDAQAHNVTVVGGSARTVGAAGGYLTGGGHSPFAHFYGLAVDNLLEVELVTPNGTYATLSKYTDPEYFWALRGGAGSVWGVIVSVTYKTHPLAALIQAVVMQYNVTNPLARSSLLDAFFHAIPTITEAGYVGYSDASTGIGAIFVQANGTNSTYESGFERLRDTLSKMAGVSGMMVPIPFPTWMDYGTYFLRDPNVATNVQDASRLLTVDNLESHRQDLIAIVNDFPDLEPGFNFIGQVNPAERNNTAVHPVWAYSRALFSFSTNWADNAPESEKIAKKLRLVQCSKRLAQVAGLGGGTYVNEANPYEPNWEEAFWGSNYEKLLKVKRRIDPENLLTCNRCVGTDIVLQP